MKKNMLLSFDKENIDLVKFIKTLNIKIIIISLKSIERKHNNICELCNPLFLIGGCDFVEKFVNTVFKTEILDNYYPECLNEYMYRTMNVCTYFEAKQKTLTNPLFIKPFNDKKKFTGTVIDKYNNKVKCRWTSKVYYTNTILNFISEYRFFIIDHKIACYKNYYGDPNIECNNEIVSSMIEKIKNNDAHKGGSYIIDIGVLNNGNTALIEMDYGYSFGYYGCDLNIVIELLEKSFKNLTNII